MSSEFSVSKLRADFPQLSRKINNRWPVYLDSAATALKPWPVIEKIGHHYSYEVANVHRGAHFFADAATQAFEETREKAAKFINAGAATEIIFTSGTTDAINLVAQSWGDQFIKAGDEIVISELEHHANLVPWQILCEKKKAHLKIAKMNADGIIDLANFKSQLSSKTKLVALSHCSNTLGTVQPVKEMIREAHTVGALALIDGAQMIANFKVDVRDLDADFYVFSAHKLYGPNAVGILYAKTKHLEAMPPWRAGGSMISRVTFEKTTYNDAPYRFEAGTPNIAEVIAFGPALDYVSHFDWTAIRHHENQLMNRLEEFLRSVPSVKILSSRKGEHAPIMTFVDKKIHASDLGSTLSQEGVAVRVGHLCTQPLLQILGETSVVRVSLSVYNNEKDIDAFVAAYKKAQELFL